MKSLCLLSCLFVSSGVFSVTSYAQDRLQSLNGYQVESYASALSQFIESSKKEKSPFSEADMAIMQKAASDLARKMPDPGLKVGAEAFDFSLPNAFGKTVNLKALLDKGPVVLVFYRGAWCPFCNMHLNALHKSLPSFQALGAQLVLVTPQTPDKSAEQIKKADYPFEVLSDLDNSVMKQYRLYFELPDELLAVYKKHGLDIEAYNGKGRVGLPIPGTFVIDQKAIVRAVHAQSDYKQRMEPADIVKVLQKL